MIVKISCIKNCGNGAGGFAPGNDCASGGGGGGGGGESSGGGGKKLSVKVSSKTFGELEPSPDDDEHFFEMADSNSPNVSDKLRQSMTTWADNPNPTDFLKAGGSVKAITAGAMGKLENNGDLTIYRGQAMDDKAFDSMVKSGEHAPTSLQSWSQNSDVAATYSDNKDGKKQVVFKLPKPSNGLMHTEDVVGGNQQAEVTRPPAKMKIGKITEAQSKNPKEPPYFIVQLEEDPSLSGKNSKNHTISVNFQK